MIDDSPAAILLQTPLLEANPFQVSDVSISKFKLDWNQEEDLPLTKNGLEEESKIDQGPDAPKNNVLTMTVQIVDNRKVLLMKK